MRFYYVYILKCSEGSFYIGMTNDLDRRLQQHREGSRKFSYTFKRLPIELVWYVQCTDPTEAIRIEKQIKGWSHRKKKALVNENWIDLVKFSKNYAQFNNRIRKGSLRQAQTDNE